jgi:hypothetical protein
LVIWCLTPLSVSAISLRSGLLVEETGGSEQNHRTAASHWYCIKYTSPWSGFELTTLVVIGSDCIGSYKSNYHAITTTTANRNDNVNSHWFKLTNSNGENNIIQFDNTVKHHCNMNPFFSFDLFMVYIPECKQRLRTMK